MSATDQNSEITPFSQSILDGGGSLRQPSSKLENLKAKMGLPLKNRPVGPTPEIEILNRLLYPNPAQVAPVGTNLDSQPNLNSESDFTIPSVSTFNSLPPDLTEFGNITSSTNSLPPYFVPLNTIEQTNLQSDPILSTPSLVPQFEDLPAGFTPYFPDIQRSWISQPGQSNILDTHQLVPPRQLKVNLQQPHATEIAHLISQNESVIPPKNQTLDSNLPSRPLISSAVTTLDIPKEPANTILNFTRNKKPGLVEGFILNLTGKKPVANYGPELEKLAKKF